VLVVVILLLAPLHADSRLEVNLFDSAHAPLFAVLALVVYRFALRRHGGAISLAIATWLGVGTLGLAMEFTQHFAGRTANLADASSNFLGALAGVLFAASWLQTMSPKRWVLRLMSLAVLLVGMGPPLLRAGDAARQMLEFPRLSNFEDPLQLLRWRASKSASISRSSQYASEGEWSMRVDMQPSDWSGALMQQPPRDWSQYRRLRFDVYVEPQYAPLRLYVKLCDGNYADYDRHVDAFEVLAGNSTIRVDLQAARHGRHRQINFHDIATLLIHTGGLKRRAVIHVDHVALE
jgi:VanZ family protein